MNLKRGAGQPIIWERKMLSINGLHFLDIFCQARHKKIPLTRTFPRRYPSDTGEDRGDYEMS